MDRNFKAHKGQSLNGWRAERHTQPQTGTVEINRNVDYFKDEKEVGSYTVTSNGLAYSGCGVDAGTITITGTTEVRHNHLASGCLKPTFACNPKP
jgi:hypothetical protein